MKYSEMATIEPGLMFETKGGVMVKTTGASLYLPSHDGYAHEVVVAEGPGEGYKYWHNLDTAKPLTVAETAG